MSGRLDGKVAIVTGATGAIGNAIVSRFLAECARLVLGGTCSSREDLPANAIYLPGDVRDERYAQSMIEAACQQWGQVNILVNAHGIDFHSAPATTDIAEAQRVLGITLAGALMTMKHVIPALAASGGGAIVNVASRLGMVAIPGQAVYSTSEGGLIMLTQGFAIDLAPLQI